MSHPQRKFLIPLLVFALAGVVFAAVSTYDFVAHLDREVHSVSCSFVPGLGAADARGTSGCYAVLMSPYSSVLRSWTWGGIPIALPALSVFAFLAFLAIDFLVRSRDDDPAETRFLIAATALPLLMSAIYFGISLSVIGVLCKLCIGIYVSSLGAFALAIATHLAARRNFVASERPWPRYAIYFGEGVLFVAIPLVGFLAARPAYADVVTRCGELVHIEDKHGVRVKLHPQPAAAPAIEVLDPLCPSCWAFRNHLERTGMRAKLDVEAVLFPLDSTCNWMVTDSMHPGACTVSEAVLCAGDRAREVVDWALDHNEELRRMGAADPETVTTAVLRQFPAVAGCLGKPEVKARLNRSLRWVASNSLPLLTPQLYVRGVRLCNEDTDLGLEYALGRLLERAPDGAARRKP